MEEFGFTIRSLEEQGLQVGDIVECSYSDVAYFSVKSRYMVQCDDDGVLFLYSNNGLELIGHINPKVWFKHASMKTKQSDFQNTLEYLDTFGIPAEVTDKGMHMEGELTKVQWLDFAKILLEGEE